MKYGGLLVKSIVFAMLELVIESNTNFLQVLERDLTIFGFFIALGRNTQAFLSANGFEVIDDPIEGFIRYDLSIMIGFDSMA